MVGPQVASSWARGYKKRLSLGEAVHAHHLGHRGVLLGAKFGARSIPMAARNGDERCHSSSKHFRRHRLPCPPVERAESLQGGVTNRPFLWLKTADFGEPEDDISNHRCDRRRGI